MSRDRRLNLCQFFAEVFNEYLLKAPDGLHWLRADELEALIKLLQDLLRHEHSRLKSLFYVRILRGLTYLLKNLASAFCALPHVAKQKNKYFLGSFYTHYH